MKMDCKADKGFNVERQQLSFTRHCTSLTGRGRNTFESFIKRYSYTEPIENLNTHDGENNKGYCRETKSVVFTSSSDQSLLSCYFKIYNVIQCTDMYPYKTCI